MKLILSTCGTSLLTNQAPADLRPILTSTANLSEKDYPPEQLTLIDQYIAERRATLLSCEFTQARRWSAELNGLLALYKQAPSAESARDQHQLLHTDTYQGRAVAKILNEWLNARGFATSSLTFSGLSVRDRDEFQEAMSSVAKWAHETFSGYRASGREIVFNLTGGFKSINGFLQTIGAFHADRVVYLFESGSELVSIPRLPLSLSVTATVTDHLETFRRLSLYRELPAQEQGTIPDTLVLRISDHVSLSAWGELLWNEVKTGFYQKELLPVLSDKIKTTDSFRRSVQGLPPERLAVVNHRLDDLSLHFDQGHNPKSLNFKQLQGHPVKGSTHQLYAWSDAGARRIFGHFEGDKFVLDTLGGHL